MNIRDEEQLQQYFERQMTSTQEQNFLINVAARDDMRLAFRSQLELLKAVREDKDASGSPMFARSKTLTALGLGGALVPSSLKEQETQAAILPTSVWQNIGTAFRRPAISITAGLLAGILGTAFLMPGTVSETHGTGASSAPTILAPALPAPQRITTSPVTMEPTKDQPKKSVAAHNTTVAHQPVKQKSNMPVTTNNKPGTYDVNNRFHKPQDAEKK